MLRQAFDIISANIRTVSLRSYQPSIPQLLIADIEKMLATVPLYQQIQSALVDEEADKLSTCVLLETGAGAASYLDASGKNCSYAWFHPSRPHNGFWGYPRSEKEILDCFVNAARSARLTIDRDCRTLVSIPPLVLLAADAYNRSRVIN